MIKLRKILFILLLAGGTLSVSSAEAEFPSGIFPIVLESQDNTMTLELMINGTSKIIMEGVPLTGFLEIYSILGVKVKSVNLRTCQGGCPIDLPKGLYILKAGKVARKVIVR